MIDSTMMINSLMKKKCWERKRERNI